MNIFKETENRIRAVIAQLQADGQLPENLNTDKVEAAPPREAAMGDIATNAAMVLAPQAGKNPRAVAEMIVPKLQALEGVTKAEIAGPGFINITLAPEVWQSAVLDIISEGRGYGNSTMGKGQRVNVEYVSANPTGPMHVGHARYIYGDAVALLLMKAGYDVTKEYYINDAGAQIDKLTLSLYMRYREIVFGEGIDEMPEGLYPGDYLKLAAKKAAETLGDLKSSLPDLKLDESDPLTRQWRQFAVDTMMEIIKGDLALLGIHFDVFTSERELTEAGKVEAAIEDLTKKGLIYTGVLEAPKGKTPDDWEARPQLLFRSTQFGDDLDRPVQKSDGSWTYFAPDIAYQRDKIQRGFQHLVMLLGVDHGGYVKRLKSAVAALSDGKVDLEIKLCQLVKFMRGGEPLKMSKRAGTFVTVREVIDEVGKDVFRFIMLTRKNDMPLDFDFAKVTEQSKDNPVFYVQYAHARARSAIRKVAAELPEAYAMIFPSPSGRGQGEGVSIQKNPKTDIELLDKARDLRAGSTDAEKLVWSKLRNRQIANAKFKRQEPIGQYIADFSCHEAMLIIELDGGQHAEQHSYDEKRDAYLKAQGYTVLRFWNNEVMQNPEGVLQVVYDHLAKTIGDNPSPCPLPGGEGILAKLSHPEELALIRLMCNWPRLVESAAAGLEPHRVAFYLQELAAAFHGFWTLGNDDLGLRFLVKHDITLTAARVALAHAVSQVIASGLMVLGVEPVEEMR